jgi:hypothetical protein
MFIDLSLSQFHSSPIALLVLSKENPETTFTHLATVSRGMV